MEKKEADREVNFQQRRVSMLYKAIGFDYGGVVNGVPGFVFMRAMADFLDVPLDAFQETFFENNSKANIQGMSWNDILKHIAALLDRSEKCESIDSFIDEWDKNQTLNQDIVRLIESLRSSGYAIGLLSNYASGLRDRLNKQGIALHFDVIGISSEMGVMKPQPEAFFKFCDMLDVRPHELVFIDDSKKSLETSEAVGYTPVLFRDYEGLVKDLTTLGITV